MTFKDSEHVGRLLGRHTDIVVVQDLGAASIAVWRPSVDCRVKHVEAIFQGTNGKVLNFRKNNVAANLASLAAANDDRGVRLFTEIDEEFISGNGVESGDYAVLNGTGGSQSFALVIQWEPSTKA